MLSDYPVEGAVVVNSFIRVNTLSSDCRVRKFQAVTPCDGPSGMKARWSAGQRGKNQLLQCGNTFFIHNRFEGYHKQQTHITPATFHAAGAWNRSNNIIITACSSHH